jgi:hypothetical protein
VAGRKRECLTDCLSEASPSVLEREASPAQPKNVTLGCDDMQWPGAEQARHLTGRGEFGDWHLVGFGSGGDQQFAEAVEQGEADADFGDLGWRELGEDLGANFFGGSTFGVDERVGQRNRGLVSLGEQLRVLVGIGDLLDKVLGQAVLLRDREANVLSIPAVGDPGIAQPGHLLGRMIDDTAAPHLAVQRGKLGAEVGGHCRCKT